MGRAPSVTAATSVGEEQKVSELASSRMGRAPSVTAATSVSEEQT
jgi:hypothetical protein